MMIFFDKIFTKYPNKTRRMLEFMLGLISWILILSPVWGSLLIPAVMAYFILFFDVFWFYKSFSLAIAAYRASKKIDVAKKQDWKKQAEVLPYFDKVSHVIIIPNYKENTVKMRQSILSITRQTMPLSQLYIVLAMEEREVGAKERAEALISEFRPLFGDVFATYHPDLSGEVKGKSSNEAYAGKIAYDRLFAKGAQDVNFATVSSVDADSIFDEQYFSYLTYLFLQDPSSQNKFWQSANVTYNNFWLVPAPIRVLSFFGSLGRMAVLLQGDRLVANSTYSLSFAMLRKIGYWDTDVIPEDYRIFFKAFFTLKGNVWVEPIFLKTSMDAPQSTSYMKSLMNKYQQERRWSWGISDDPLFIKWWFTVSGVPFVRKTVMLYHVLLDHLLWPVYWFIITIAANIMPFINPVFTRTTLGYNLPRLAGFLLTSCLLATLFMIVIDFKSRPKLDAPSKTRQLLFPLEFVLLPVVGFFLSALPALISHTQLMFGKRMEYKVTEKM